MADGVQSRVGSSVTVELRIANDITEIERVAEWVDEFGAKNRLANEIIIALNVSLDEIINNIISYGYEDSGPHAIVVRLKLQDATVEAVVEDDGKPFNPLLVPAPDLTAQPRKIGGVGLHFVRNLMDHLEYAHRDGTNQLRLMKKLTK
jgi:anti-sigma regulatory factor (Ser/Thr protein kinase)